MVNIIIQISKYLIIILMAAYTFSCFSIFTQSYEDEEKRTLIVQDVLMFLLQLTAFTAMYLATDDIRVLFIYAALAVVLLAVILLKLLITEVIGGVLKSVLMRVICILYGRQRY